MIYPAAYPHVLSVAALDPNLAPSGFSSENTAVDVAAPGVGIPLAIPARVRHATASSTASRSPAARASPRRSSSGAAAWLATARPDLSNGQLADVLRRSALDVSTPGYDPGAGFGLIQMAAALALPGARPRRARAQRRHLVHRRLGVRAGPTRTSGAAARKRSLGGTADRVEDPVDVYRIRLPSALEGADPAARAVRQPRPLHLPLQREVGQREREASSRARGAATKRTDSVTITNRGEQRARASTS